MHPYFHISKAEIQALNDSQARELVARLCKAELQKNGYQSDAVSWGGDQRARDGGVDVRVELPAGTTLNGYIPSSNTVIQVKAEPFGRAKILSEMAPEGLIRPAILDLSEDSGSYVIASTRDDLSDSSLKTRKEAMVECLRTHGIDGKVKVDFYDSRKIADWVESHPSIAAWVKNIAGKSLEGWKPYGPWAYHETDLDAEYILDDKVKVKIPDSEQGIDIHRAIERLRNDLLKGQSSVRIVGLSGVGKTRLVQALFDSRIQTDSPTLNQENVLYTDLSDNPSPQPTALLEALNTDGSDSIVVIDNCNQEVHQKLTEIVKKPDSKLRLITVEYDIRDHLPEGSTCYHLEGSSNEVISKLLARHFSTLSDLDVEKIVQFSDGNARVAFALASTSEIKGQLARLQDDDLFNRLFRQKHSESNELQRCAESASLLYSFNSEDSSESSEMSVLAAIAEVSIPTFFRNISELHRRGLIQERGKWKAVLPHAISNRLALIALQSIPIEVLIQKCVTDAPVRMARSFSRRLGYLHESKHAQQIVLNWLSPSGFLGDISQLDGLGWEIFENVAPVNQRIAVDAILRAMKNDEFRSANNSNREKCARLLRSLAYEPHLFDDAISALLMFEMGEPDDYRSRYVTDILDSLFYSHLSGTLASPEQREKIIRSLASGDTKKKQVAHKLLKATLETHHFTSSHGFEFGALKRSYGWYPRSRNEMKDWYERFINLSIELGNAEAGGEVRAILGASFRGIWWVHDLRKHLLKAARELNSVKEWLDGWIGVRNTLHYDKDQMDPESLRELNILEEELAPKNLMAKIQAKVLSRGQFGADLDDDFDEASPMDWYTKAQKEAKELGVAAAEASGTLENLRPYLSRDNPADKILNFGIGVGQATKNHNEIVMRLREIFAQDSSNDLDTQFLHGLLIGWNQTSSEEVSAFLEQAVDDEIWSPFFPNLQFAIDIDNAGFLRLIRSLEIDKATCWNYSYLGYGRRSDALSVPQIATLLSLLAKKPDGGIQVAIDILFMVIYGTDTKNDEYKNELRSFCSRFIAELDWSLIDLGNEHFINHFVRIIEFALECPEPFEPLSDTLNRLIQLAQLSAWKYARIGSILAPFFRRYPIESLNAFYTPDKDRSQLRMLSIRLDRHGDTAISYVPNEALIEWCQESPGDRCLFAAETCKLFEVLKNSPESTTGLSSIAAEILAIAPDKKAVLIIFLNRFRPNSWSGSLAHILRGRLQYVDNLNPSDDLELAKVIEELKVNYIKHIEDEEKREHDREISRTATFE